MPRQLSQAPATWLIGSGILVLILAMLASAYTIANRIAQPIVRVFRLAWLLPRSIPLTPAEGSRIESMSS